LQPFQLAFKICGYRAKFLREVVWSKFGPELDLSVPMLHPKNIATFLRDHSVEQVQRRSCRADTLRRRLGGAGMARTTLSSNREG
jgi:hypothetical protein